MVSPSLVRLGSAFALFFAARSSLAQQDKPVESPPTSLAQVEDPAAPPEPTAPAAQRQVNPYAPDAPEWTSPAPVRVKIEKKKEPEEEEVDEKETRFEDTPEDNADDTGHVVPTTGWTETADAKDPPPYSVGGVTAQISDDTWFKFYGFLQTRYVTGQHVPEGEDRTSGGGFSLARARLFYYGRLTDWLRVLIRVGATSDGTARFEQAFADFRFRSFSVRVGQFYLPVFQEQSLSPVALQGLDFSAVGSVFDGGQTQGVRATWSPKPTRVHFFVTDGWRTGFSEAGGAKVADIAVSTRIETVIGTDSYAQFDTGSSFRGEELAVLVGGGIHYQSGGELRDDAVELASMNADVTVEANGMSLHGSASLMNTDSAGDERVYNYGFVGQGGLFVLDWTEIFARYEALVTTKSSAGQQTTFRGVTAGFNQFVWPARGIRVAADFTYYFDPIVGTAVAANPNAGLFPSVGSQWSSRVQFNVLF